MICWNSSIYLFSLQAVWKNIVSMHDQNQISNYLLDSCALNCLSGESYCTKTYCKSLASLLAEFLKLRTEWVVPLLLGCFLITALTVILFQLLDSLDCYSQRVPVYFLSALRCHTLPELYLKDSLIPCYLD